ncbi:MAG: radical SAM family heme chaperone HemW [Clostridia bacterium]|nr:radical SAM family heme chaperone HemW [Clostridia bacterium]
MTGIYIHIPFCKSKCPYCDFYSFKGDEKQKDSYLRAVLFCLKGYADRKLRVDTLYFGGGTPSVFGGERIERIIAYIREAFDLQTDAEITVECNPSSTDETFVRSVARAGVNRISMGMQSAVDRERSVLGRPSGREDIARAVKLFTDEGIKNISLDLMLGVPHQTMESLDESIDFILSLGVKHISAYMLKIEKGTPFSENEKALALPDEDAVADMYLHTSERLRAEGFSHYEISNFAPEGYRSRHNTRYWKCEDYIGIGPSAHSCYGGKRFYYPRSFDDFISGKEPVYDGEGGGKEEYIMLSLRLSDGLDGKKFRERYGCSLAEEIFKKAEKYERNGLLKTDGERITLTPEGFLLSNSIISDLLY